MLATRLVLNLNYSVDPSSGLAFLSVMLKSRFERHSARPHCQPCDNAPECRASEEILTNLTSTVQQKAKAEAAAAAAAAREAAETDPSPPPLQQPPPPQFAGQHQQQQQGLVGAGGQLPAPMGRPFQARIAIPVRVRPRSGVGLGTGFSRRP